jgi:hypothetical protein
MPIESDKEIVKATSQTVVCRAFSAQCTVDGKWSSAVIYDVLNENGERVDRYTLNYEGEAYNDWWAGFNDGKSLYDFINTEKELDAVVDDSVEDDFINQVEE